MVEKKYVTIAVHVEVDVLSTNSTMGDVRRAVDTEDDIRLAAIAELNRRRIEAAKRAARDRYLMG